jgi:RHS repeat-associated protein
MDRTETPLAMAERLAPQGGAKSSREPLDDGQPAFTAPSITLPKGGGAIRSIGEKFTTNAVSGTSSLMVPLTISPGRSNFNPQLSLSYDSGTGNGVFGLGWNVSLPSITRKTDKGVPRYNDLEESDVFIISSAEDLVPILVLQNNTWMKEKIPERSFGEVSYNIRRYRPRVGSLLSRVEKWSNTSDPTDVFWRSISKDNVTTWYGRDAKSRIFDPADPRRIFTWLVCESHDDKGNAMVFDYRAEDSINVSSQGSEMTRERTANRYLKSVRYGNHSPYFPTFDEDASLPTPSGEGGWFFEVVFDYGAHHVSNINPSEIWPARADSFSQYRSGFEIRTHRLCRRVLMFHHFPNEPDIGINCLVRSTDFEYSFEINSADPRNQAFSLLQKVTHRGYERSETKSYVSASMPPLEFTYSEAHVRDAVDYVDPDSLANVPEGIDGTRYQWVDLDGEGTSGILSEQAGCWFFKRNESPLNYQNGTADSHYVATFGPIEVIKATPSTKPEGSHSSLLDLDGNGCLEFVQFDSFQPGYYSRTRDDQWDQFATFSSLPKVDWNDSNLKFVDLNGDGHADILITEQDALVWHRSLALDGFGEANRVSKPFNEDEGPAVVFSDKTESIYLADMSGDGLSDLVRIRNGEICYWPSLGYCRFGAKVAMDSAPWFDDIDHFSQKRIRLADIDGSGTTDILYLGRHAVHIFRNQAGNSWGNSEHLNVTFTPNNLSNVTVIDLLGNGTSCLVWSSSYPEPGQDRQMCYVDLFGGIKPSLLTKVENNLGLATHIYYAPSTRFYLQDKKNGNPWVTRLPFPVQCVQRVEVHDRVSHNYFITRYAYHHGFYDGLEREFRGFGMVEQWDTEHFSGLDPATAAVTSNWDIESHVPPVLMKTWYHTGAMPSAGGKFTRQFQHEYYRELGTSTEEQLTAMMPEDTPLPITIRLPDESEVAYSLSFQEIHEASRVLKGSLLRQEVYSLDTLNSLRNPSPYSVSSHSYTIELVQPLGTSNQHAVFFSHARETVNYQYEHVILDVETPAVADPRVSHSFVLHADSFGNVLQSATINYGRRSDEVNPLLTPWDVERQSKAALLYTETQYTNAITTDRDSFRAPLACEQRNFELVKMSLPGRDSRVTNLLRFEAFKSQINSMDGGQYDLTHEDIQGNGATENHPYRRLLNQTRILFRHNDLTGPLHFGLMESLALPYEIYKQSFTPGLAKQVYVDSGKVSQTDLDNLLTSAGYIHNDSDSNWWTLSGKVFYSSGTGDTPEQEVVEARSHFFIPRRFKNPFSTIRAPGETFVSYDSYDLMPQETRDALNNRTTVGERDVDPTVGLLSRGHDYRLMRPRIIMDTNRNRSAIVYDILGMVVGTIVAGKPEESKGDSDHGFTANLPQSITSAYLQDPLMKGASILSEATTRVVYDMFAYSRTKVQPNPQPPVVSVLSRTTHNSELKTGEVSNITYSFSYSDGLGRVVQSKIQAEPDSQGNTRWVRSGWTLFNNKGKPFRQYEPYFTPTHQFEPHARHGVSNTLFYDPLDRPIATLHPNHTWSKVIFDAWRQESWDQSDTCTIPDPTKDLTVGKYFKKLPTASDYLPTWFAQREGGSHGPEEQEAALKAKIHAETPTISYFDTLGRPFLVIDQNQFVPSGGTTTPTRQNFLTRTDLDIQSFQRQTWDANDRLISQSAYDMQGNLLYRGSMEAGKRWMLNDVLGKLAYTWNSRNFRTRISYDELRRPLDSHLSDNNGSGPEILITSKVYGEGASDPFSSNNLRGKVIKIMDQAGVLDTQNYDFKGNPLLSSRQFATIYDEDIDWNTPPSMESTVYSTSTSYNAKNMPTEVTSPDRTVVSLSYNEANMLESIEANLQGIRGLDDKPIWTPFVTNIDYDPKGQQTRVEHGNGIITTFEYNDLTFQLSHRQTVRGSAFLQDLRYTYDTVGNITKISDSAQQTVYFRNSVVNPSSDYTYDSMYRLIAASGREHLGQLNSPTPPSALDTFHTRLDHPGNGSAMANYSEEYIYDAVGNIMKMRHQGSDASQPGWTRNYKYNEPSLLEPGGVKLNNRLSSTSVGPATESYSYDEHGNVASMPQLSALTWNYLDQLKSSARQVVNNNDGGDRVPEITSYVYDATGQRVRKVTGRQGSQLETASRLKERLYVGGFEVYREYSGDGTTVSLERESLHIMAGAAQRRVAIVETRTQRSERDVPVQLIRYQFDNQVRSAVLETDDQGEVISYEEYYPFGGSAYQAVDKRVKTAGKRYRFMGKEQDDESGLYYFGSRYYASWIGRWISCEPLGFIDGPNLYAFARNNPVCMMDQDGNEGMPSDAHQKNQRPVPTPAPSAGVSRPSPPPPAMPPPTPPPSPPPVAIDHVKDLHDMFTSPSFPPPSDSWLKRTFGGDNPGSPTDTASERLTKVLKATSNGPAHFGGPIEGWSSQGFRPLLDDRPLHVASSNQVGHFLTAVHLGFDSDFVKRPDPKILGLFAGLQSPGNADMPPPVPGIQSFADLLGAPKSMSAEEVAIRIVVGHEKKADLEGGSALSEVENTTAQFNAATSADVDAFKRAVAALGTGDKLDLDAALAVLKADNGIKIDQTLQGNSYQDMLLTVVGWRLGSDIKSGKITDRNQVADWVMKNLHK